MNHTKLKTAEVILLVLAVAAAVIIGIELGRKPVFYSGEEANVSVIRSSVVEYSGSGAKEIKLTILSSKNVLVAEESIEGDNCSVLDYYLDSELDIFEFNPNFSLWVLGNRSDGLAVNLSYFIPYNCSVNESGGKIYTLSKDETDGSGEIIPAVNPGSENSGGGGGSGGAGSKERLAFVPIVQAKNETDFSNLVDNASSSRAEGKEELQRTDKMPVYLVIAIISAGILILLGVIAYVLRRRGNSLN